MSALDLTTLLIFHYFILTLPASLIFFFFFFNDTATTEIYTLSLHDALPISVDQPGLAAASTPDAPTLVAGLDDHSRRVMEDAQQRRRQGSGADTWQFDQDELEAGLTQTNPSMADSSAAPRPAAPRAPEEGVP